MGSSRAVPTITGESLLKLGQSLKILALLVIVLLSVGLGVVSYTGWQAGGVLLHQVLGGNKDLLAGFGFLMLLTVGYLVGKGWATTRHQSVLIQRLVEKEAVARALQLDPVLEFHHPVVCAEFMMRQASYASRVHSRLALVQMTIPELSALWEDYTMRPVIEQFFAQLRRQCRPLDGWVRWTDSSLLLLLVQVTEEEVTGVVYRWRSQVQRWWEQQDSLPQAPTAEWRYLTVARLGDSGDILAEVRQLLDPERFAPTPMANLWQPKPDFRNGERGNSTSQAEVTRRHAQ